MAMGTTNTPSDTPPQRPTAGITPGQAQGQSIAPGRVGGMQPSPSIAGPAQGPDVKPAEPQLWTDIDPTLLHRLYPGSKDAAADALKAGQAAAEGAMHLVAAQQVPPPEG